MIRLIFPFLFVLISQYLFAQDFVFFSDSPNENYYDPSWGYAESPSTLNLLGVESNKIPVDVNNRYSGFNSLKLQWISKHTGNWELAIAEEGWVGHDVTSKDTIIFYLYSESIILSADLPKIYLEDLNNKKTERFSLSNYQNDLETQTWYRVSVPLQIFKDNPQNADLTKIKTFFLDKMKLME